MGPGHENQPLPTPTQLEGMERTWEPRRDVNTGAHLCAEGLALLAKGVATIDLYISTG